MSSFVRSLSALLDVPIYQNPQYRTLRFLFTAAERISSLSVRSVALSIMVPASLTFRSGRPFFPPFDFFFFDFNRAGLIPLFPVPHFSFPGRFLII